MILLPPSLFFQVTSYRISPPLSSPPPKPGLATSMSTRVELFVMFRLDTHFTVELFQKTCRTENSYFHRTERDSIRSFPLSSSSSSSSLVCFSAARRTVIQCTCACRYFPFPFPPSLAKRRKRRRIPLFIVGGSPSPSGVGRARARAFLIRPLTGVGRRDPRGRRFPHCPPTIGCELGDREGGFSPLVNLGGGEEGRSLTCCEMHSSETKQ